MEPRGTSFTPALESEIIASITTSRAGAAKGVDMRYALLLLLLATIGLSSDLGPSERAPAADMQPIIFAAALGSH
jgi:hypothetical protein